MDQLKIASVDIEDALILCLAGEVDLSNADLCAQALVNATAGRTPPLVVLDLTATDYVSMAGVRVLGHFADTSRARGVPVCVLLDAASVLRQVIRVARIQKRLPMFDDLTLAIRHMRRRRPCLQTSLTPEGDAAAAARTPRLPTDPEAQPPRSLGYQRGTHVIARRTRAAH